MNFTEHISNVLNKSYIEIYPFILGKPDHSQVYDEMILTQEILLKVEFISAECCDIHLTIIPSWDGEGTEFDICSLESIELLENLKEIEFISFENVQDQTPLLKLKQISKCQGLSDDIVKELEQKGVLF